MALTVSCSPGSGSKDPTSLLRQSLLAFEKCLTQKQRDQFRSQSATSTENVIAFAQQIDAQNLTARRCAAPRLMALLQATKQFSEIVDTFVSSNPPIAALIWGSLKTAVLVASNVCSYFERVTALIMEIGKSCPVYEQFAALYSNNKNLQQSLSDYFAIIIQICTRIIEVSQRSTIAHAFSSIISPFESDFSPLCHELNQAQNRVDSYISLAAKTADAEMKKLLEDESKRNLSHRLTSTNFFHRVDKDREEAKQWRLQQIRKDIQELRSRIRANLSSIDHIHPWKQAMAQRVPGTAEWLQQESVFQSWLNDPVSSLLWCAGTMGIGKTILLSHVLAQLQASREPQNSIAYYLCCADNVKTLRIRNILGSLISQLLHNAISTADETTLYAMHRNSKRTDPIDAAWWVTKIFEEGKSCVIVVDGLDECQDTDLIHLDKFFTAMLRRYPTGCKILCTGRPELEGRLFKSAIPTHRFTISRAKVAPDMNCYIASMLSDCLGDGRLRLGDPALQPKIAQVLNERADGMFLWTRLVIEELCAQNSDSDLMKALENLPKSLSEIFQRTINRIERQSTSEQATKLLRYCGVAKEPLDLMQHREVLAVCPGQKSVDHTRYPNSMSLLISNCFGFLFVDEEKETIHFTHRSIQQYLFTRSDPAEAVFEASQTNVDFGIICMTYLGFLDFKRQMVKSQGKAKFLFKPRELGLLPVSTSNKHLSRYMQRQLRKSQASVDVDMQDVMKKTQDAVGEVVSLQLASDLYERGFRFIEYARQFWIHHVADMDTEIFSTTWILFRHCVEGDDVVAERPWESRPQLEWRRGSIPKVTDWLIRHRNHALLQYQIRHQRHFLVENVRQYILSKSADLNLCQFTETMIQSGINQLEDLQYGLRKAAEAGRYDAFERYRKAGADIDVQNEGETMLQAAAMSGSVEILTVLLNAGLDPDACGSRKEEPPLRLAVRNNHVEAVNMLLHAGANVDEPTSRPDEPTLLQEAALKGYLDIVDSLLAAGADVNAAARKHEKTGRTALQAAAQKGYYDVVVRLLDAGADVNAPPHMYGFDAKSALQWAAGSGNLEVVNILLQSSAEINTPAYGTNGQTALQAAANGDHVHVVRRLLACGAEVNAAYNDWGGYSALQHAARRGNMKMVSILLDAGADVNAPASKERGGTALQSAVQNGHPEIVKQLLAAGAEVDAPGSQYGGTAFQYAVHKQRTEIEEILRNVSKEISVGAKTNQRFVDQEGITNASRKF